MLIHFKCFVNLTKIKIKAEKNFHCKIFLVVARIAHSHRSHTAFHDEYGHRVTHGTSTKRKDQKNLNYSHSDLHVDKSI